jgi:hypothetical protein
MECVTTLMIALAHTMNVVFAMEMAVVQSPACPATLVGPTTSATAQRGRSETALASQVSLGAALV